MTELRARHVARPAWGGNGGSHLALDAIVAYVDEELTPGARRRALEHLARCTDCAAEVVAQTQARWLLRAAAAPSLPSSLLSSLRAIPQETELPEPPAGLAVGPDGELVSVLRPARSKAAPERADRRAMFGFDRRVLLGAGAAMSGLALSALAVAGDADPGTATPVASLNGGGPTTPASTVWARHEHGPRYDTSMVNAVGLPSVAGKPDPVEAAILRPGK